MATPGSRTPASGEPATAGALTSTGFVAGGSHDTITKNVAASALVGGVYGGGAGLMNFGTATLNNVAVTNNTAYGHDDSGYDGGGGIYNRGTLNLNNSRLVANTIALSASAPYDADISGGGLFNGLAVATIKNTATLASAAFCSRTASSRCFDHNPTSGKRTRDSG